MTLREQMLACAARCRVRLGPGSAETIQAVRTFQHPAGGFRGRSAEADLYYTMFALQSLGALGADLTVPDHAGYLASFGDGGELDLVHLCCLIRCWADLGWPAGAPRPGGLAGSLDRYACPGGGFGDVPGAEQPTVYATFLGVGAREDLNCPEAGADAAGAIESAKVEGGGYANSPDLPAPMTATTAAAVCLRPVGGDSDAVRWLAARALPGGGFAPADGAPEADLLSTATALLALHRAGADLAPYRRETLAWAASLRTGGGYRYCADGGETDPECIFYALLTIGCLQPDPPISGGQDNRI